MSRWVAEWRSLSGTEIIYQPIGSAAGINEVTAGVVDFAVTDAPLVNAQLLRDGLAQFPIVIGGIVPIVNLDGVQPGQLRLTPDVMVGIFLGRITSWADPAILRENPGLHLADRRITVIWRSDGSGTTYNFTDYLSKVSAEWRAGIGSQLSVRWPVGVGAKGSSDVTRKVAQVKGAIGYIEYSSAMRAGLAFALVRNAAGFYVEPSPRSFQSAVSAVDWDIAHDFHALTSGSAADAAWPIMATSFVLLRSHPADAQKARRMRDFFHWALTDGRGLAAAQHYLPLPASLVEQVDAYWALLPGG